MDYNKGSLPLFPIAGIPIRLHYLFIVFLILQVVGSAFYGGLWPLLWFLLLGPVLLITVLVHELGHCFATRRVGGHVEGILLWPLGGLAFIGHNKGPKADMWVAVAGPLTHIPMVLIWLLAMLAATAVAFGHPTLTLTWPRVLTVRTLGVALCIGAVVMNISLFVFNLLVPAYPLDGGRILVDSLLMCGVAEKTTALITCAVATPLALAVVVLGCVRFQVITILVGLWILWATWQLFDCYRKDQLQYHPMFAFTHAQHAAQAAGGGAAHQPQAAPPNPFAPGGPAAAYTPPAVVQGYPVPHQQHQHQSQV